MKLVASMATLLLLSPSPSSFSLHGQQRGFGYGRFSRGERILPTVGWLRMQKLGGSNLLSCPCWKAETLRNAGAVGVVRAVMVPVRPSPRVSSSSSSSSSSGNGASVETASPRGRSSVFQGTSSPGAGPEVVARVDVEIDAAEMRAGLRDAQVADYDPIVLSRRYAGQPLKVCKLWCFLMCPQYVGILLFFSSSRYRDNKFVVVTLNFYGCCPS